MLSEVQKELWNIYAIVNLLLQNKDYKREYSSGYEGFASWQESRVYTDYEMMALGNFKKKWFLSFTEQNSKWLLEDRKRKNSEGCG